MSSLSESLKELKEPKKGPSNFRIWLDSLSDEDRVAVLDAMRDNDIKKFPLFETFRKAGLKVSKDTFFSVRDRLLDGTLKDEEIQ